MQPDEVLEIYLTPGEFYFGDASTRVRTLLGEGGVIVLWHAKKQLGAVCHFCHGSRFSAGTRLDPGYADEAMSLVLLEMSRAQTKPGEYVAKVFVHDDPSYRHNLDVARQLLRLHEIKTKIEHVGAGNLVCDFWNGEVWLQKAPPSAVPAEKNPAEILEVYLNPGEWYFGDEDTRIKTLLGSCVSFTLWHPRRKIGGMCHYMLPSRGSKPFDGRFDGRYADEALALMVEEIKRAKSQPREFVAKVFGGGVMLDTSVLNISARNIDAGRALIEKYGFQLEGECLGGVGHRNVIFDLWSGQVWLKKNDAQAA